MTLGSLRAPVPSRSLYLAALVIAVLTVAVFFPALDNDFVNWDDDHNLTTNEQFRGLGVQNLRWMFTTFHMGHYQPLTWLTFGVDHALWGMNPLGYHLTNVLLHAAAAVALFFFADALLRRIDRTGSERTLPVLAGSFAAACLFAIHPLRVESVAWATERRDCLSGLFFVLALLAYLRYTGSERGGRTRRWFYILTTACVVLSLLSKAWGMTLPVVMLILDVYPLRRLEVRAFHAARFRRIWYEKIPFVALAGITAALAIRAQSVSGALRSIDRVDITQRIAQSAYGLIFYVWRSLWPVDLSPIHDRPPGIRLLDPPFSAALIGVVVITVGAILARRRLPALLAVWVSYIVIVSPVLGIVQSGSQLVADRYSYLSCIGWALLAGGAIQWLWSRDRALVAGVLGALVIGLLSARTWRQVDVWQDSDALWTHVLEVDPSSATGHQYRAALLVRKGRLRRAVFHYKESLKAAPRRPKVHENLGIILTNLQRYEEAETHLIRALEVRVTIPALKALAIVQRALGRDNLPKTIELLLRIAPNDKGVRGLVERLRSPPQRR